MSSKKASRLRSSLAFVASGAIVVLALVLFLQRQYIADQVSVWSYTPSSAISAISDSTALTPRGKFLFYATKPSIEGQAEFNVLCPRQEVGSPILGCYTSVGRIYIYDITNEKLRGMEEVTAVHEMLHAAWARLNDTEKQKLGVELRAAYDKQANAELKSRMQYYERTEPGEFINELHSILGTEVADLGEPLESYYAQLFNRSKVLSLHEQYYAVYQELYGRADTLYKEMQTLSTEIQTRSAAYDAAADTLASDIQAFNTRAQSGSFTSIAQFNQERAALVARSNTLDAQRETINQTIAQYTTKYEEYRTIAGQIEVLNDSIDSFKQIEQTPSL